jgi:NodT family efflux transporter outer membrane factor (OMF) lipoprotein
MKVSRLAATVLVSGALEACSFAPSYRVPASVPAADAYREVGDFQQALPLDSQSRGSWWSIFQDAELDKLEAKIADDNQDLKAAFARLQQARATTRIARSALLPTLSAQGSAVRSRTSADSPRFPPGIETVGNNFDVQADLSYEFDVWGRVRNITSAARANQQASAADLADLTLAIHAEVAADYFTLRSQDAEQTLIDRTTDNYAKSLQLVQNLHNGGAAALADVAQAQALLETARTQAADIRLQRAMSEHAMAVLLGENPSVFHWSPNPLPETIAPPPIDPGLPSTLLERRPDVAAAERRVAAANAQIGVARAAYFPLFNLTASAGYESTHTSDWLTAPSRLWSVGPTAVLSIFDYGRHHAQSAQAKAAYEEQVASYRNTVLVAYQEVEDYLAALHQLHEESVSQAAAVSAARQASQQAEYRYKAGLVTYLEVASSENQALQAEIADIAIRLRRVNASVLLIKALGGGWRSGV